MKTNRVYLRALIAVIAIGMLALVACGKKDDDKNKKPATTTAATSKVIALKFHADYCKSCKSIEPTIASIKQQFKGADVLFVKLDFTTDATQAASAKRAKELGLTEVMKKYGPKTGFVLVLNSKSHEVLERLTKKENAEQWAAAVKKAIDKV